MVPSNNNNNNVEANVDRISNLPTTLTDKILQRLSISEAARMSVLSKKWQNNWLTISSLRFDYGLWEELFQKDIELEWQTVCNIICNVFLLHHGPINEFLFEIPLANRYGPYDYKEFVRIISWLLCFLSRNGVIKISLSKLFGNSINLSSRIFSCTELKELVLYNFIVTSPPAAFKGFVHLTKLELSYIIFKPADIVGSLIASCPKLASLHIRSDDIEAANLVVVIDAPRLENLILVGAFETLVFKNVANVAQLDLSLDHSNDHYLSIQVVDAIKNLAASSKLEWLTLRSYSMKILAAGGGLGKSLPLTFNYLAELTLLNLDLYNSDVFFCTIDVLQRSPSINKLVISAGIEEADDVQHELDYEKNYKLSHLREVKFEGLTWSHAMLKLIEYVLHVSINLENLFIIFKRFDDSSELKVQRQLNRFKRASPQAKVMIIDHQGELL